MTAVVHTVIARRCTEFEKINPNSYNNIHNDDEDDPPTKARTIQTTSILKARHYPSLARYYHNARKPQQHDRPFHHVSTSVNEDVDVSDRTFYYTGQEGMVDDDKFLFNRLLYKQVVIASSVTEIHPECFAQWKSLEQVLFEHPSQCRVIGSMAFYGCSHLKRLNGHNDETMPESVQIIGSKAFSGCDGLETVTLPSSVISIRRLAFRGCTKLYSVILPSTIQTIGFGTFADCTSLRSIQLPCHLQRLEASLFANCTQLRTIRTTSLDRKKSSRGRSLLDDMDDDDDDHDYGTIQLPPSLLSIGNEAFRGCHSLGSNVRLPSAIISIGNHVFEECIRLRDMTLPDNIQEVGDGCFRNCYSLERLTLPLDVSFGVSAFERCHNFQQLVDVHTETIIYI
ncbi:hypothetical protein IV203_021500 [Nitzschia inconspicua]|uniref:Leucine rich repeat protein n=1 Tax=Nitzschia inconspicua TaxID=303405 RepID=A0A9K3K8P8_9STRA|nr:hypothetical protein IV203_022698 [Nitzschia inconspicua]KAG7343555.1 hypothetical protein IV203_021500 [Nitzschia inconspicua]